MTNGDEERGVRRILVALDASPHSMAALQAAAELASRLGAELSGIFVEDINLVRLADMPFAREVSHYSSTLTKFDRQQMERELRAQAGRARRALAIMAERSRLRSSFHVTRGVIASELLQAVLDADLLIIGKAGWSRRRRMGSTTRVIVAQSPRQTLILQQGTRLGLVLGLIFDGSPPSFKALQAAVALLHRSNGFLTVIVIADDIEKARHTQAEVNRWLRERGLSAHFRWLIGAETRNLAALIKTGQFGALVVPGEMDAFNAEDLVGLVDEVEVPVLIVR